MATETEGQSANAASSGSWLESLLTTAGNVYASTQSAKSERDLVKYQAAATMPSVAQPVGSGSGISQQTLMIGAGVAIAAVLILVIATRK